MLNPITTNRPRAVLAFVLSCFALAALDLAFQGCKTDDVLLPHEKVAIEASDVKAKAEEAKLNAAEAEAKAAGAAFVEALKSGDAAAQSAALTRFEKARGDWQTVADALKAIMAEQDAIISAAQRRAAVPVTESAKLLGVPAPLVEILAGLGIPLAFDRSRKHLRDTLVNALKGNIFEALKGPLRAAGLIHSSYDPRVLMEAAAKQARDKGDFALEIELRQMIGQLPSIDSAEPAAAPAPAT